MVRVVEDAIANNRTLYSSDIIAGPGGEWKVRYMKRKDNTQWDLDIYAPNAKRYKSLKKLKNELDITTNLKMAVAPAAPASTQNNAQYEWLTEDAAALAIQRIWCMKMCRKWKAKLEAVCNFKHAQEFQMQMHTRFDTSKFTRSVDDLTNTANMLKISGATKPIRSLAKSMWTNRARGSFPFIDGVYHISPGSFQLHDMYDTPTWTVKYSKLPSEWHMDAIKSTKNFGKDFHLDVMEELNDNAHYVCIDAWRDNSAVFLGSVVLGVYRADYENEEVAVAHIISMVASKRRKGYGEELLDVIHSISSTIHPTSFVSAQCVDIKFWDYRLFSNMEANALFFQFHLAEKTNLHEECTFRAGKW